MRKFEQAREEYASVKSALDVGRKALRESLRQALAGGYAIMRNTLRDDPIALEAWEAARRSPRAGRLRKTGVAPVTEPPQSQEPPPHAEPADVPPHVATGLP